MNQDSGIVCRDASQFKLVNAAINIANEQGTDEKAKPPSVNPEKKLQLIHLLRKNQHWKRLQAWKTHKLNQKSQN